MKHQLPPVSFEIFSPTTQQLRLLKPITSLSIFENNSENFHPQGLFSTEIFGRLGTPERESRFAFIDVKVDVLHPLYFKQLSKLKRLYGEIITSKTYAIFDKKEKDFIKSNEVDGETGYAFFLRHFNEIEFKRNESHNRSARIDFLEKYRQRALIRYIVVLPAGLRDIEQTDDGRTTEDEVNSDYRKLISSSNAVNTKGVKDESILDTYRCTIQSSFNNIYNHFNNLISGKEGFIMQKWASRNLENGTRTVITGASFDQSELGDPSGFSLNSTIVGLFQMLKAVEPLVTHNLLNGILAHAFIQGNVHANLIDKKTLKSQPVNLDSVVLDKWTTSQGIVKLIDGFKHQELRNKPVLISNHYLALVYKDDKYFKVFYDIDDLPDNFDKSLVKPITYAEMFYLSYFEKWNKTPVLVTRYPITGAGSIYPSIAYVKPTTIVYRLSQLNDNWEDSGLVAYCYPETNNPEYIDSASPASNRLGGLGADGNVII